MSHIDYYKLLFNNLSSSDKWQCCIYKYNNSFWHWYHQFYYIPLMFLHLQQQPNETIQQNRSTWQLLKTTCTNYFYYYAWLATFVLSGSGRIVKVTIQYILTKLFSRFSKIPTLELDKSASPNGEWKQLKYVIVIIIKKFVVRCNLCVCMWTCRRLTGQWPSSAYWRRICQDCLTCLAKRLAYWR